MNFVENLKSKRFLKENVPVNFGYFLTTVCTTYEERCNIFLSLNN